MDTPRNLSHTETRMVPGSADYVVRSVWSDGSIVDRRYRPDNVLRDVIRVHVVHPTPQS